MYGLLLLKIFKLCDNLYAVSSKKKKKIWTINRKKMIGFETERILFPALQVDVPEIMGLNKIYFLLIAK